LNHLRLQLGDLPVFGGQDFQELFICGPRHRDPSRRLFPRTFRGTTRQNSPAGKADQKGIFLNNCWITVRGSIASSVCVRPCQAAKQIRS
jgi:hypothetical protein